MASNATFHRFSPGHTDLILSLSYNFYGTRLATASADHRVKVWDRSKSSGTWSISDTWTAHNAEVTDVSWNGPFVGEHIATIGEDGLLKVWMEDFNEALNTGRRWRRIFERVTGTGMPFMNVEFKAMEMETYLAVTTRDGILEVLEPEEQGDLSSWRVLWSEQMGKGPAPKTEETGFRVSWHQEKLPAWPLVLAGLDRKALSLAVAVGKEVRVYRTDRERRFYVSATLEGAKGLVRDVTWANGSMRGFDVIATASKDGFIRVYEVHTPGAGALSTSSAAVNPGSTASTAGTTFGKNTRSGIGAGLAGSARGRRDDSSTAVGALKQEVKLVAELEAHAGSPWRVQWSQMGDALTSTGDDGTVRLWKKAIDGKWLEAMEIDATKDT